MTTCQIPCSPHILRFLVSVMLIWFLTHYGQAQSRPGFIENKGQITDQNGQSNDQVLYVLALGNYNVLIHANGFSYQFMEKVEHTGIDPNIKIHPGIDNPHDISNPKFDYHRVDFNFHKPSAQATPVVVKEAPNLTHYYNVPNKPNGVTHVKTYSSITIQNQWKGIDVEYLVDKNGGFKYNFIVHKPIETQIQFSLEGALDCRVENGKIKVDTRFGSFFESIPFSYGINNMEDTTEVHCAFEQVADRSFALNINFPELDKLIVDPMPDLVWGTYYGGAESSYNYSMMKDNNDSLYVSGITESTAQIATTGTHQGTFTGSFDAYVGKFDLNAQLVWGTYYGGTDFELCWSIAPFENTGFVLCGNTRSTTSIATAGAYQTTLDGISDCYIAKFFQNGLLDWATYYGGEGQDDINAVVVLGDTIYVGGSTSSSTNISTLGTHQPVYGGSTDGFIAKFGPDGSFIAGTYLGGSAFDAVLDVDTNSNNQILFCERTRSAGLAVNALYSSTFVGTTTDDGLFGVINPDLTVDWSNYFGGTLYDAITKITADQDTVYISGYTQSTSGITTAGSYQPTFGGGDDDSFMAKFNPNGSIIWSTYIGGDEYDEAFGLHLHDNGNLYICGLSYSSTGLTTPGVLQPNQYNWPFCDDGFVVKVNKDGNVEWSTYYGGDHCDEFYDLVGINMTDVAVSGVTKSVVNIATPGVHQDTLAASAGGATRLDAMLIRLTESGCPSLSLNITSNSPICSTDTLLLSIDSGYVYNWTGPNGFSSSNYLDTIFNADTANSGTYTCEVTDTNNCVYTFSHNISVYAPIHDTISVSICQGDSFLYEGNYYSITGSYDFTYSSMFNCDSLVNLDLKVTSPPAITSSITSSVCEGDTVYFSASSPSASIFSWSGPSGFSSGTANPSIDSATAGSAGIYTLLVTDTLGCIDSIQHSVNVFPEYYSTVNSSICMGDSISFGGQFHFTTGVYYDSLLTTTGCDSIAALSLTVESTPTTTLPPASICAGSSLTFGSNTITSAGTYFDTLSTITGCDSILSLTVSVSTAINTTLPSTTICDDESFTFGGITIDSAGIYSDTLIAAAGCDSIVTIEVLVSSPITNLNSVSPSCYGDSILLSESGSFASYNWIIPGGSSLSGSSIALVSDSTLSGTYYLTVVDSVGCSKYDSTLIIVPDPITLSALATDPLCGSSNGQIQIIASGGVGTLVYGWSPAVSSDTIATGLPAGSYTILVEDQNNCSETIIVDLINSGSISGSMNCDAYEGFLPYSVNLNYNSGMSGLTYVWIVDSDTLGSGVSNYTFNSPGSHTVQVLVSNGSGCSDSAFCSYFVYDDGLVIPNVMTPNGDGQNDLFTITEFGYLSGDIIIFNRWGQVLYQNDYQIPWDGTTLEGEKVPEGTYYYVLTMYNALNKKSIHKGHLMLHRN